MSTPPLVLLVEDSADNRGLIRQIAELMDVELVEATNGEEGLALAHQRRPDVILMDLSLPVLDGWEATRRLKADPATRAIPVVALTAHAMEGDEARARAAGCDAYVTKPIGVLELQQVLGRLLPGEAR
jgi:two-component system cell cycle response regulator DivK